MTFSECVARSWVGGSVGGGIILAQVYFDLVDLTSASCT